MKLPYGKDSISVWKRTVYVRARIYPTEINGEVSQEGEDDEEEGGEEEEEEREEEDESENEDDEDEEEEEEEGEGNQIHPPLSHGTDTLAVTYMSIADLNKLREDSETKPKSKLNTNALSSKENSKLNSKLIYGTGISSPSSLLLSVPVPLPDLVSISTDTAAAMP